MSQSATICMAISGSPTGVVYGDREDIGAEDTRIWLFVRGADGRLWERFWTGSAWDLAGYRPHRQWRANYHCLG